MSIRLLPLILLLCLVAPGCSSVRAPSLTVESAKLTERTDAGMVITFTVLADNPNGQALPLRDATYTVWLADKPVFSGTRSAQATVSRYGTQTFALPAAVPLSGSPSVGTEPFRITGRLMYIVPGALAETLFDIHVRRPSTHFHGDGTVDLSTVAVPPPPVIPGTKPPKPAVETPGPSPD
jgi:hypothetical protein